MGRIEGGYRGEDIVSDSIVLYLDATYPNSYRRDFGTTWKDMSGSGRNFTAVSNPVYTPTSYGAAFTFNGSSNYFNGPASNAFSLGQNYTVELVGGPTRFSSGISELALWLPGPNGGAYQSIAIYFHTWAYKVDFNSMDNSLRFNIPTLNANNLAYYQFRFRNSTSPYRHAFINGAAAADSGAEGLITNTYGTDTAKVGGNLFGNYLQGIVSMVRIYNRALSDAELLQNYNAQKTRFGL